MYDFLMWAGGIIFTAAFGIVGWVINMIFGKIEKHSDRHDDLETRFDEHRLYAAENFTTKKDVEQAKNDIIKKLEKIENKLWPN